MKKLRYKTKYKLIITADFNIDTSKNTNSSNELKRIAANYNFTLHITENTRKNACIDHILSNIPNAKGRLLNLDLSDHNTAQTLSFELNNVIKVNETWFQYKHDFNPDYIHMFKKYLSALSWSESLEESDVNNAFNAFHEIFKLIYELCFPINKIKHSIQAKKAPWFTAGLRKCTITKRNLRFLYYKDQTVERRSKYHRYTKLLRKCISEAQKITNAHYILKATNKIRATWDVINNKIRQPNAENSINLILNDANDELHDPNDIANYFNDYFINLTSTIDISVDESLLGNIDVNNSSIFLYPTDIYEIYKIINSLKPTNSTGYDNVSTRIVKLVKAEIAPVLSYLINLSFTSGSFPDTLKTSIIKPILKKGDKSRVNNYRPISLIPVWSKIFEKAMQARLSSFINKHNLIRGEQNGFQKGKSTTLTAFSLVDKIIEYVDVRTPLTAVFFDMSRAFDHVAHKLLLRKCETYGIRGLAHDWIKSYLCDRKQFVEIQRQDQHKILNSHRSNIKTKNCGVPQGSILGPLLFLIYINDLPMVTNYSCTLFADDVSVVIPCINEDNYNTEIIKTVKAIIQWLTQNNLKININKTKFIQFVNRNRQKKAITVSYENQNLTETSEVAFLGITLDDKCTWEKHILKMCNRINSYAYVLWKLGRTASREIALQAYYGHVSSILRYGIVLWGNSSHINKLFIAQKSCIRAIFSVDSLVSCRPLFKELRVLTISCIYIYEVCVFVRTYPDLFKRLNDIPRIHSFRRLNKLVLPMMKTTLRAKNSRSMAIQIYNKLPIDISNLALNQFRIKLKTWLIQKCFYNLNEYFARRL
jgi:hypothetical protein